MGEVDLLTEQLITARIEWDERPSWKATSQAYTAACAAFEEAGVTGLDMHRAICDRLSWTVGYVYTGHPATRTHLPAVRGATVPDAVQGAVLDLVGTVAVVHLEEARRG